MGRQMTTWIKRLGLIGCLFAGLLLKLGNVKSQPANHEGALPGKPIGSSVGEVAYFQFRYPPYPETFVFQATDAQIIQEARNILVGQAPSRHITGVIVKYPAAYNPPWSYHLDPTSVAFFDVSIEVCDASILIVEQHLQEVCGSFLPGCQWCPWGSRLVAEIRVEYLPVVIR